MRWLRLAVVLELHRRLIQQSGGMAGLRDLGFSLIQNHPFVDGNKRTGHAAMETTLVLNGFELSASVDAAEAAVIAVASGRLNREAFTRWVMANQRLLDLP